MKATIIERAPMRLIVAKSASFPDGNRAAFHAIEAPLESLRGRQFYGLVYEREGGLEYFAGLVPESDSEEQRFAASGFAIEELEGGTCARMKLHGWADKLGRDRSDLRRDDRRTRNRSHQTQDGILPQPQRTPSDPPAPRLSGDRLACAGAEKGMQDLGRPPQASARQHSATRALPR